MRDRLALALTCLFCLANISAGTLPRPAAHTATLRAYVTSTGALIGTLKNNGGGKYRGQFTWPSNPQNITVKSSLGGSASKAVATK